jgi:thiol-disulfide isomerase/thioredoxin
MASQKTSPTKRDRRRAAAEAKREAVRKEQQRRNLTYALGGIGLIAVVVIVVMVLMAGGGDGGGGGPSAAGEVTVQGAPRDAPLGPGETVPGYRAPRLGGGTVAWSDHSGRPVVLSLWAPWCPHCQAELPVLDRVMQDYPAVGFTTIATSIDPSRPPSAEAFMADKGLSFPVAVDDGNGTLASAFGLKVFPTLYFVNSDGTVAQEMEGEVDEATLRSTIEALQ